MPWHFLFAPRATDSLLLTEPLPTTFTEYLSSKGLALPTLRVVPDYHTAALFTPFGWNEHTFKIRDHYHNQPAIPNLEVIRTVNSRAFSLSVEKAIDENFQPSQFLEFEDLKSLENFLSENLQPHGWVVKANHGHAGTANRRIGNGPLGAEDSQILSQYFLEQGKVVLEPWHCRLMDMAVNFQLEPDGTISDFCGHELLNSQDGSFLGIKISPDRLPPLPWRVQLETAAIKLGKVLAAEGYFGPVSVDAYLWETPKKNDSASGAQKLRPYVDINARLSMALPVHGLARRLPSKWLMWTWIKPRKLQLPKDYFEFDKKMEAFAFDEKKSSGILATSPVFLDPSDNAASLKPKRIGFLFCADSETELTAMQNHFSSVMRKK